MTSGEHPPDDALTLQVHRVSAEPQAADQYAITLHTSRGDIAGVLHAREGLTAAVVWVGGASGGLDGPADAIYPALGEALVKEGVASLRLDYRAPNHLVECTLDALAGVSFLGGIGAESLGLVGHSFGGAVAIAAGVHSPSVKAVAALSSQTYGATDVALLAPRPLLLVHGLEDTRLPPACSEQIFRWARQPKDLVLIPGAGHGLRQCRQQLFDLLKGWLVDKLRRRAEPP